MKILSYVIAVSVLITAAVSVQPQQCPGPNDWFTAEFVSLADQVVPISFTIPTPDVNLKFFREIMHFSDAEIEDATEDAINFFSTRFGLDFSDQQPDELGRRFLGDATFFAVEAAPELKYTVTFSRWLISGRTNPTCFENRDGGFLVAFSSETMLYGTYGGVEGKPIQAGEIVVWGYYNIPVCPQQPLVIQFESGTPFRTEPVDGIAVINCDLYHRELGKGVARGVAVATPTDNPEMIRFTVHNTFTFPANPNSPN